MQLYTLVEDRTWNGEGINYCTRGTKDECALWISKNTSSSFVWQLTHGGYKLLNYK